MFLVQTTDALRLEHLAHGVDRTAVDGVIRGLRLKENLDGVEGVADGGDDDPPMVPAKTSFADLTSVALQLAGRLRRGVRGEGHRDAVPARIRGDTHAGRVVHGAETAMGEGRDAEAAGERRVRGPFRARSAATSEPRSTRAAGAEAGGAGASRVRSRTSMRARLWECYDSSSFVVAFGEDRPVACWDDARRRQSAG